MKLWNIIWIGVVLVCGVGCSSFLDVQPKDKQSEKQLFATRGGFYTAVNGIYNKMASPALYGKNLSYELVDVISKRYQPLPVNTYLTALSTFAYTDENVKKTLESTWTTAYNTILNCNVVLENIDESEGVLQEQEYRVLKGEMLAVRAFLHFDMLRLFGPVYKLHPEAEAIPYNESSKVVALPLMTADSVLHEKILRDLDEAEELLADRDPVIENGPMASLEKDEEVYLRYRQLRMNYYAVLGLKARICLYAKDVTAAYGAANEVILAQQQKGLFPWVKTADITTTEANLRDRTFSSEHLFAFNTTKLEEYIKGYFREASLPLMERLMPGELYEADDYRTALYETYSGFANVLTKFWQMDKAYVQGQGNVTPKRNRMPAIRIAEMYYIAAEALKESNIGEALEMLNTLRVHRGLMKLENLDKDQLQEELGREYYREFIGEGQVFFYHKRMNTSIIATANAVYVLPMPDDEIDLGQREQ